MSMEKEKLQKIVAIAMSAICVVVVYYYVVLEPIQLRKIAHYKKQISGLQTKLEKAQANDKKHGMLSNAARQDEPFLAGQESKIVRGDHVAWLWREMGDFSDREKMPRVVVVPEGVGMNGIPENDSYQSASASLNMYCGYHKVGEFVRDLENTYPTLQVQHLEILGSGDAGGALNHTVRVQFQLLALREKQPTDTEAGPAAPAKE